MASLLCIMAGFTLSFGVSAQEPTTGKRELRILNWTEYMDPDLIARFEEQFNAKITEYYFEDDQHRNQILVDNDGKGFDIALVDGGILEGYLKNGWLAPINAQKIPNLVHLNPRLPDIYEGAGTHAVPYFWGAIGIAYRKDLVKKEPESWQDIFQAKGYPKNKIQLLGDARDVLGVALKSLGYSSNSSNRSEIKSAYELVLSAKDYIAAFEYTTFFRTSGLISGDVWASVVYGGDAYRIQKINKNVEFVVPKEGTVLWMDYLTISSASENKDLAHEFINFINEPKNAAQLAKFVHYSTPNLAAIELMGDVYKQDPIFNLPQNILDKSEFEKVLPPKVMRDYVVFFAELTSARRVGE